jgi:nitroimidazol reductase NimA-like FMN-containing flavoprotein (pyridoxamine 5'-phosphate oxidase superfamily)
MTIQREDQATMNVLDVDECMVLLRWEVIGRLGVSIPGEAPSIVPVNFTIDRGAIVFRTGPGEKHDHLFSQPVSLQADRFDWYRHAGWSVLVQGTALEVDESEVDDAPVPWAPGEKVHLVRIVPTSVTGRRIELDVAPLDGRGYR